MFKRGCAMFHKNALCKHNNMVPTRLGSCPHLTRIDLIFTTTTMTSTEKRVWRKHFIPLESNPDVFTELIHKLGVSKSLCFQDVLSLDEPELLAFLPRPAHALVLVFPTSPAYLKRHAEAVNKYGVYHGAGEGEDVVWFKQTINNACGLYAILHAINNGEARDFVGKTSQTIDVNDQNPRLTSSSQGISHVTTA